MFDIGWQELFIIVIVGIIVIGPKDLPRVARAVMGFVRKARMMAHEFQDGVDDMIRQADMEDIKNQVGAAKDDIKGQITNAVDPDGTVARDLDLTEFDDGDEDDKEDEEYPDEDLEVLPEGTDEIAEPSDKAEEEPDKAVEEAAVGPALEPAPEPEPAKPAEPAPKPQPSEPSAVPGHGAKG